MLASEHGGRRPGGRNVSVVSGGGSGAGTPSIDCCRVVVQAGYERAVARHGDLEIPFDGFFHHVEQSVADRLRRVSGGPDLAAVREVLEKTHLEDLYLALGMALGREHAWVRFKEAFGTFVLASCLQLTHNRDRADEVVGNLLGDLFFTDRPRGSSRIRGYTGASSIQRWLWLVLKSRVVDSVRIGAREGPAGEPESILERLETKGDDGSEGLPEARALRAEAESLLGSVVPAAFGALDARDRLLMRMHYLDGVQQKEIARVYGVDSSRVCRWLERAERLVRRMTCERLVLEHGLEPREASELAAQGVGDGCASRLRDWLKGTDGVS